MPLTIEAAAAKDARTGYADLQHRHFATIAAIIKELPDGQREAVAKHFANRLQRTNANFNPERFLAATER
jgi:hypothetical protein